MGSCLSAETPGSPSAALGVRRRRNSKKRFGSRSSSFDFKKDEHLLKIPGRLFFNGSSEIASLFTQQGKKGTNQDAMLVWENFCSRSDTIFCGVFDGHGPFGHMVAKRVRDSLPQKLNAHWEANSKDDVLMEMSMNTNSLNSEDTSFVSADEESRVSAVVDDTEKQPDVFCALKETFLKAFRIMDRELRVHPSVDCFCSGTTAVTLIKQGLDLVIGNVGDSRAVLGTRNKDNSLTAVQLTVDLKPNLPAEAERIKKCRGRVFALRDEPDVSRVWLPNSDSPGLAMSRAFGDFCLKDFGVIAVPDVSYRRLTEKDEFIVLATDGIWDVLSNTEVVNIVAASQSRSTAAKALVETAVRSWKLKYPTSKIDDCAVICLFLDSNTDNLSSSSNGLEKAQTTPGDELHVKTENEDPEPTGIDRSGTVKTVRGILQESGKDDDDEDDDSDDDAKEDDMLLDDYSALEGVTRVNTLLNLPRFTPG
ncbi:hypothetical protein RND81_12G170200 [Saponaria officinalis]|uniref:protein-serine/threonine phosphatase n=1 Tax=Saponaria officinalis TaxID=3572 RepID=A0AAW1HBT2_SAPOF